MKRALLIEWNASTGERAGSISPRDPKLRCCGWQNMDVEPAIELRLVEDDRDLSVYRDVKGTTVLEGTAAINVAIDEHFKPRLSVDDERIFLEHIRMKLDAKDMDALPDDTDERLKVLKNKHKIKGIRESKPIKVKD